MTDMKSSEGKNTSGSNKTSGGNAGGTDRPSIGVTGPTKASGQAKPSSADKGRSAQGDYLGYGDSFMDTLGNFLAGMFGFSEMNPATNPSSTQGAADWGFDPIGMGLGLAGSAVGIPGLGTAYGALGDLTGGATSDWGKIGLGPSVFGGGGSAASPGPSAGAVGAPSGSVQTMGGGAPREPERGSMRLPLPARPPGGNGAAGMFDAFKSMAGSRMPQSDLARAFMGGF